MTSKSKKKPWAEKGLEDWGAYMEAKKEKLEDQFDEQAQKEFQDATSLFSGIAIFVNGYTNPCADELKRLMMAHGGIYHHYMRSRITTHIIASNLPYSKIVMYRKSQNPLPICKPEWITDSLKAQKLLDWRPYVLYSNCTKTQPQLQFTGNSCTSFPSVGTSTSTANSGSNEQEDVAAAIATENLCTRTATVNNDDTGFSSISKINNGPMSTKNSEFLSEFYNNSRLHHISTMGTMFKDYVNELRSKSDGSFPGLTRLKILTGRSNACPMNTNNSDSEEDLFESSPNESVKVKNCNEPVIMHIDMDFFFVSVGLRNRPEMKGFPIAVTHAKGNRQRTKTSKNGETEDEEYGSMSEVASCSYEARQAGVKNGMFLGQALKLCPNLKTIQYDFEGYKEVSYALYDTVASYTLSIEAVSCDEMYADVTNVLAQGRLTPLEFASLIRNEIRNKTGCPVSTGFGCNKLQARLATRKAKPDGQFYLESVQFTTHIGSMSVRDLPGVGYSTMQLMKKINVHTCSELYNVPLGVLQKEFGKKTGEMLYNMCRGIDNSKLTVEHVRKSVSAEVNYGIRFENENEAVNFLTKLSEEVCNRLHKTNAKGRSVTLKLMVRAKDAPKEAMKFMGHGICDNFTKSKNCIAPTDDPVIITREVISLWSQMQQPYEDIRGVGIQISRLELLNARSGSGSIMNFINKSKKPDMETATASSRQSSSDGIQSTVNFVVPGQSSNEKLIISNPELKEAKPRGLKAFLVPKTQCSSNRNAFVDHNVKLSSGTLDIGDIDESTLAELPEHIRKEILEFRSNSNISNNCKLEPSTSTACKVIKHDNPIGLSARNEKISQSQPVTRPDQVPSMTNIDQSVLNELPEDIRNEILGSTRTEKSSSKQGPKKSTMTGQTQQERYFKHSKSSSGKCDKSKMPPIEEIDMSVLIELPEDIRNEIINEYKANKQAQQCKNNVSNGAMENKEKGVTEQQEHNMTNGEQTVEEAINLSFSQVDPEFLAALSEDMKTDVEMYCMVKKKEKLTKMKKKSEANSAMNKQFTKNPNVLISNKKNVRFPKSSKMTNNIKNLNDRRKVETSPEKTKKSEPLKADGIRSTIGNPISGRFLQSEFHFDGEINGSLERREEIISHHSSFTGNIAKTDDQVMLTNLVNYLFTLPLEQAKMQIRRWISNSDDVNEIDLLSLATFLSMLPKKKRLEDLHILLKTMHRCIMKTGSCVWHETYRRTVYHVQRYMQIEYKSNMMLPTIECDLRECKNASC